jgi:hypothetical protein
MSACDAGCLLSERRGCRKAQLLLNNLYVHGGKCFWNMGTSEPFLFKFLKNLKPHMSMSQKIIALNIWKGKYRMSVHKKSHLKILYTLGNTKKTNF